MSYYPKKRVVITGLGPVASVGVGKDSFWRGILDKNLGIELTEVFLFDELWEKFYLHKVQNFDIKNYGINENDLEYIHNWKEKEDNQDLLFLLVAAKLALDDSQINYRSKKNNLALVATHENPCLEQLLWKAFRCSFQLLKKNIGLSELEFCNELYRKIIKIGYESQSFMSLFHLARTFNVHNYSLFINNACSSGLYALEAARDLISLGKAEKVIVVAGDCPDVFKYLWFKMISMYEEDGKIKPFDKNARGFVMGEGAAALVLEDYESAKRRGIHIYAEYLGGGFALEGWGITTPMIGGAFYQESIENAINDSGVIKEEIDLICAHGAGTIVNDYYEAKAIKDTFQQLRVPVTAFKPFIGHNLGGSALLELIILLLSLEKNLLLPILNTREIDNRIDLNIIREEHQFNLRTVLKICSAFAGYNACSILRKLD